MRATVHGMRLLAALALLAVPSLARAAEPPVSGGRDGAPQIRVVETTSGPGGLVEVIVRTDSRGQGRSYARVQFDCAASRGNLLNEARFLADVRFRDRKRPVAWYPLVPGSEQANAAMFACLRPQERR